MQAKKGRHGIAVAAFLFFFKDISLCEATHRGHA
jgi:hypothetical protein